MKKSILSVIVTLIMLLALLATVPASVSANSTVMSTTRSIDYAKAMGIGWNLGNTFDGRGGSGVEGWETSWGNPITAKEFIQSIKDRGFEHIRIPLTIDDRHSVADGVYTINQDWLDRYIEVVQWAADAGLAVMINIHHDAWIWLGRGSGSWDGDVSSTQYKRFSDHWKQLAEAFAHMPDTVMFETINEPEFNDAGIPAQEKLDLINKAAYDAIRAVPGNENRIIVIPTMHTNHGEKNSGPTRDFIKSLNDENVIATVHYYSVWFYSTNIGKTLFDEGLGVDDKPAEYSARDAADELFDILGEYFLSEGIGVSIGEWGLLGYDNGVGLVQKGEELKYYEYINHLARENAGVSLSFWDNGLFINRYNAPYDWNLSHVGAMIEPSAERSSYSTGLDTLYFSEQVTEDVEIPLTLNDNEFIGIEGLTEGVDYIYSNNGIVIIDSAYMSDKFEALGDGYGLFDTLIMQFSGGNDWEQYLVKYAEPEYGIAAGTRSTGITIPVEWNGAHIRSITAEQDGRRAGGTKSDYWEFLHNGEDFRAHYDNENPHLLLTGDFFSSVKEGEVTLSINYFDGQTVPLVLDVLGEAGNSLVTTIPAPDLSDMLMPVNINSLTYYFTVEGITDETMIKFEMIGDGWPTHVTEIMLADDGFYNVTKDFGEGIASIIHLGFVHVIADSGIMITLNSIYVNDTIKLEFLNPFTFTPGDGSNNTLPHRWYSASDNMTLDGELLYNGMKVMFSEDKTYWLEFSTGEIANETGMFVLYHQPAAEEPAEPENGDAEESASASDNSQPDAAETAGGGIGAGVIALIAAGGVVVLGGGTAALIMRMKKKP